MSYVKCLRKNLLQKKPSEGNSADTDCCSQSKLEGDYMYITRYCYESEFTRIRSYIRSELTNCQ
jgi:hypothetical protein